MIEISYDICISSVMKLRIVNLCGTLFRVCFDEFFQLRLLDRPATQSEVFVSPSSISTIDSSSVMVLNGNGETLPSPNFSLVRTMTFDHINQFDFHHHATIMRITIPTHQVIVINNFCQLDNCLFTLNIRSIHLSLYTSSKFINSNWNSLRSFSVLPLLKSLHISVFNAQTILDNKDCQIIVEMLSMLTDFAFCFRRETMLDHGHNENDVCYKSILNLRHHIFIFLLDQQSNVFIEPDGCGLIVWL